MKRLTIRELKFLRSLYANNNPKYVPTLGLIDHFICRFVNHSEWIDRVQFLTINGSTLKDGTFVMLYATTDGPWIVFNSLESTPYRNLGHLLNTLSYSEEKFYFFLTISEEFLDLIQNLVKSKNLETLEDYRTECHVFKIDRNEVLKILQKAPEGFYYDSLNESDVAKIKSTLPYVLPNGYLETVVKYNPTTALYRNDGQLISYTIMHETGETGMLEVMEKYKRRGFGREIILRQALKLQNMGRLLFRYIIDGNIVAHNFSDKVNTKVSDETPVGKFSYITVKPMVNENLRKSKL